MSVAGLSSPPHPPPAGRPINATLDDSSPEILYSGWTSASPGTAGANVEVIKQGRFFRDTVSYTTTRGASAKFSFQGVALYVFGPTGPTFGKFSISIDGQPPRGQGGGGSRAVVYDSLLYFGSGFGEGSHTVVITNEEEGKMLALDFFIATALVAPGSGNPAGAPNSAAPTPVGGPFAGGGSGTGGGGAGGGEGNGNGSSGAVIGGILGSLAALALLFLAWRYHKWKKTGGEGSFLVACCGPRRKPPQAAGPGKNDFRVWPMVRSRPKYAT